MGLSLLSALSGPLLNWVLPMRLLLQHRLRQAAVLWVTGASSGGAPVSLSAELAAFHSANFVVRTDIRGREAERILDTLEGLRPRHLEQLCLHGEVIPEIELTIYKHRSDFDDFGRQVNAKIVGAHGVTTADGIVAYLGRSRGACLGVLMHELTHAYLRATGKRVAIWLNEGLACYFGGVRKAAGKRVVFGVPNAERLVVVNRALRANRHVPLKTLVRLTKTDFYAGRSGGGKITAHERLVYGEASTLVRFLKRSDSEFVRCKFERFLTMAYETSDTRQAFETIYGTDYAELERRWRSYVMALLR